MSDLADAVLPLVRTRADLHRWSASNAYGSQLHEAVVRPCEAVAFALHTLEDPRLAWALAHPLDLDDPYLWDELATAYEKVDPLAALTVHTSRVRADLEIADAKHVRAAARRLARMRALARRADQVAEVDQLIAELRTPHRRRPRLQQEFDRAGLP